MRRTHLATGVLMILALLSACGGDSGGGGAAATATATHAGTSTATARPPSPTVTPSLVSTIPATSTATPLTGGATATSTATHTAVVAGTETPSTAASVSGLVVLRQDFQASAGDALGAPPAAWMEKAGTADFDRGLSFASWRIEGPVQRQGQTDADGSFTIADLPPGEYRLELSKTLNGNLLGIVVPFHVGDGGRAELVIEIAQGAVRWSNVYDDHGAVVRETSSPNGSGVVTRDGVIVAIHGSGRAYVDDDGDGSFEPQNCTGAPGLWLCAADGDCVEGRICTCLSSCPDCEDCSASVCAPKGTPRLYRCGDQQCANPQDTCACVSSCPVCDDCTASACAPGCAPAQITGITVSGTQRLYVGQRGGLSALAQLSDGGVIDVTQLVDWNDSATDVVSVDAWGTLTALAVGAAEITATLGDLESDPWTVEVVARPPLQRIVLQNLSCNYPYGVPDAGPGAGAPRPLPSGVILPPDCRQVVRIGGTLYFFALGEFADGYYEDITSQVTWDLDPAGIGEIAAGVFKATNVGTTKIRARLGDVASDATEVKVVDQPTIVALQIYPLAAVPRPGPQLPDDTTGAPIPCYDCGYQVTILKGDELPFQATAAYDTGEWEDVTARVTWASSDAAAPISDKGVLTAAAAGETVVTATLGEVSSNEVKVRVVDSATLLSLSIYQEGLDRVVAKGDQAFFRALGYYDIGLDRDVTAEVSWKSSDETVGGFDGAGTFVGRSAGNIEVWAELDGVQSNHVPIEVFQTSSLAYCDDNNINRVEWSDAFNRVVLESDCALYSHPDVATLRFTVTERERPNGIFDPCLDLYVYQGDRIVRTIREEGCGQPFLAPGAPEFDEASVRYQTLAFWDLRDDRGSPVPPGSYTIQGRFYLYYDPVVSLPVVVNAPDNRIPCVENACGNGCGYVHACGDDGPPSDAACPTVCTKLCECPAGWGITAEGDCEPCAQECCPRGAACLPGTPTCEPPPVCCPPGQSCIPELPPCDQRCCPFGALCGPLALPPCDCCPIGAQCIDPALAPCEPQPPCCPKGALCILPLPVCQEDCCPTGAQCADGLVACDDLMCCRADGSCVPGQAPCK